MVVDKTVFAKILASKYKKAILFELNKLPQTPTMLRKVLKEKHRIEGSRLPNISQTLSWFKDQGMVSPLSDARKGRLYSVTAKGSEYAKELEKYI